MFSLLGGLSTQRCLHLLLSAVLQPMLGIHHCQPIYLPPARPTAPNLQRKTGQTDGDTASLHIYLFCKCCSRYRFQPYDSALWSRFSPSSSFVNGHVSTMWFMVCRWPQSQEGDQARPHLCKLARHGPWPVRKRFIRDHVWRGRSKPGC